MNERKSSKRFDLEALESRVLLSADASLAAFSLPAASLAPSEVFEETCGDLSQASDATIAYDPGVAIEEIFAQAPASPEPGVAASNSESAAADTADESLPLEASSVLPNPIEVAVGPQSPVAGMAEQLTETLTGAN